MTRAACGLLFTFCLSSHAVAHSDAPVVIESLDTQIEKNDKDPLLYLQRAEMNRVERHYDAAAEDYEQAAKLGLGDDVRPFRAQMYLDAGEPEAALAELDPFLKKNPDNGVALKVAANAYGALEQCEAAAKTMEHSLETLPGASADHYLALMNWQECAGDTVAALNAADAGLERLGVQLAIVYKAIDLAQAGHDYERALGYLDRLPAAVAQQTQWQTRRSELECAAGRCEESAD